MSTGKRNDRKTFAPTWKQYAQGIDVDLVAESPDGATCACAVVPLASGTFTKLIDSKGANKPISVALPAGFKLEGDIRVANCSTDFIAYW